MTLDTTATALAVLASTPVTLRSLVAGVPSEALTVAPAATPAGEWCVRDVLAHLVVNDPIALERFRVMAEEDDPAIAAFDEEAVLAASGARDRDVARLLDDLDAARGALVAYVRGLSTAQLARPGRHSEVGMMRGAELLHHLAFHELNHIRQVATLLATPLDEHRGPLRVF